jgi:hypothetical protein
MVRSAAIVRVFARRLRTDRRTDSTNTTYYYRMAVYVCPIDE